MITMMTGLNSPKLQICSFRIRGTLSVKTEGFFICFFSNFLVNVENNFMLLPLKSFSLLSVLFRWKWKAVNKNNLFANTHTFYYYCTCVISWFRSFFLGSIWPTCEKQQHSYFLCMHQENENAFVLLFVCLSVSRTGKGK